MLLSSILFILASLLKRSIVHGIIWTPFDPVSLPLAVKSPYLNAWLPQGNDAQPISTSWPFHWPASHEMLGWKSLIVVDNVPFWLLGVGTFTSIKNKAALNSVTYTPSSTSFNLTAGPVNVQLDWLSPIEVDDLTRLSIPFVYVRMTASSVDGEPHDVRVRLELAADMISGDHSLAANASSIVNDNIVALKMQLQTPQPFVEIHDFPEDAAAYVATKNGVGVSYEVGVSDNKSNGTSTALSDTVDSNYSSHALAAPYDGYGIMINVGNVSEISSSAVFTIGVVRDPSIKYTDLNGEELVRHPFFKANFSSDDDLISFVLNDFNRSLDSALAFDSKVMGTANKISSSYADLLALTTRQSLSALEVTISQTLNGSWNTSDVKMFVKDMGDMGSGGVNAASVIYSALPMYLSLAPNLLAHLLSPLLEAQRGALYTQPYAAQHLGIGYPNATAQNAAHNFGIEESANMLILVLAHAQATMDLSLASNFYELLRSWTEYLVHNALAPGKQQTNPLDGISASNQTNLALKGVIGIAAMGGISTLLGQTQDADTYDSTASSYMQRWVSLSKSANGPHILTAYGDETSTGLLYNLFSDKILGLNLVPDSVYQGQTDLYRSMQDNGTKGLPLATSNPSLSRSDWTMFTAATCTDNSTRDAFVSWVHQVASKGTNSTPLGVVFNLTSNTISKGTNSPAHGSMYALLAVPESSIRVRNPSISPLPNRKSSNLGGKSFTARIIGSAIGGLTLVLCVAFALFRVLRRRRASGRAGAHWLFPIPYLQSTPSSGPRAAFVPRLFARADDKVEKRREVAANGLRDNRNTSDGPGWTPGENRSSHEDDSVMAQASIKFDTQAMNETAMEMELQVRQEKVNALYERRGRPSRSYVPELLSGSDSERPPSYDGH